MFGKDVVMVPKEELEQRRSQCDQCEFKSKFKPAYCKECTCVISIKTLFPWEKCPIGKW